MISNEELIGYMLKNGTLVDQKMDVVAHEYPMAELWGQLAEELDEAAQAAMKMQRLLGKNKPRKSAEECINDLHEELGDVHLTLRLLQKAGFELDVKAIAMNEVKKLARNYNAIMDERKKSIEEALNNE